MLIATLFNVILQTNQQAVQQVSDILSFIFTILFIIAAFAILHVFVRWVIGTSEIIKQQNKIIELLTKLTDK